MQLHGGRAGAVVGPHHLGAEHDRVRHRSEVGVDREAEEDPARVGAVPFEVPHTHTGDLDVLVGTVGEGTVHVGPRGTLDLGPVGLAALRARPVGRVGDVELVVPLSPSVVEEGLRRVDGPVLRGRRDVIEGGWLFGRRGGGGRPQREKQGAGRQNRRRAGQGTTHYGWCLHIRAMTEKEFRWGASAPFQLQRSYQIPPVDDKRWRHKHRPKNTMSINRNPSLAETPGHRKISNT